MAEETKTDAVLEGKVIYFKRIEKYKKEIERFIEITGIEIERPKDVNKNKEIDLSYKINYCIDNFKKEYGGLDGYKRLCKISADYIELRNKIVEKNNGLVVDIAKKFAKEGLELDDLVQRGKIGLIRAVELYDPKLKNQFSTYAYWAIQNHILRGINSDERALEQGIRIPINVRRELTDFINCAESLRKEYGREPSNKEIALNLKISVERAEELQRYRQNIQSSSLDKPIGEDEESTLIDFIKEENLESGLEGRLPGGIETLLRDIYESRRNKTIFKCYYGIGQPYSNTIQEIGKMFGMTNSRVGQICQTVSRKIRYLIEHPAELVPKEVSKPRRPISEEEMKRYLERKRYGNEERIDGRIEHYCSRKEAARRLGVSKIILDELISKQNIKLERKKYDGQEYKVIHDETVEKLRKVVGKKELLIGNGRRQFFSEEAIAESFGVPVERVKEIIKKRRMKLHPYGLGIDRNNLDRIEKILEQK
jgi:RNA polymerase primary sigma factor